MAWRAALKKTVLLVIAMTSLSSRHSLSEDRPQVEFFETTKPFADVVQELEFAITERNFRITGRNKIGNEIRKPGYPTFPNVEIIHFCNLEYAREILTLEPRFVAQIPCRITVHEEGGLVLIGLIGLPQDQGVFSSPPHFEACHRSLPASP